MPRITFFEDFIGQNGGGAFFNNPSFFHPWFNNTNPTLHKLEHISEDGISALWARTDSLLDRVVGLYLDVPEARAKKYPVFGCNVMFRTILPITDQQLWFGFSTTFQPSVNGTDTFYGFFLDNPTAGGANWQWVYRSGFGGPTDTGDTGFKAQTKFWYEFEVALTPKQAIYTLNGKLIQRNKRDANLNKLYWVIITQTKKSGEQREFISDFLSGSQER